MIKVELKAHVLFTSGNECIMVPAGTEPVQSKSDAAKDFDNIHIASWKIFPPTPMDIAELDKALRNTIHPLRFILDTVRSMRIEPN
jgi:hypothetical protein